MKASSSKDPKVHNIVIETATTLSGLERLESRWRSIEEENNQVPLPLTHEWMMAWWHSFGDGADLCIKVATRRDKTLAVAPLMLTRDQYRGVKVTKLSSMANGYSPLCGILWGSHASKADRLAIIQRLIHDFPGDILEFRGIGEEDSILDLACRSAGNLGRMTGIQPALTTPIISLRGDFDTFLMGRSKKFRKSMRGKLNKFRRNGLEVRSRIVRTPSDSIIEDMISISSNSWKNAVGKDLRRNSPGLSFLEGLIEAFGPLEKVRVWIAYHGDVPAAYEFHIIHNSKSYPVRADFDERYRESSPGSVVEYSALHDLFLDDEVSEYYSCADDYRYLSHWTSSKVHHFNIEIFGASIKARLLYVLEYSIIPLVRRIIGRQDS